MKFFQILFSALPITLLLLIVNSLTDRHIFLTYHAVHDEPTRKKIAQDIVTNLSKGDFEAVRTDFSGALKQEMSPLVLKDQWANVELQVGKFENVLYVRTGLLQGYNIVVIRCKFVVDNLNLEVIFNEEDKVIGIHTKP